jgi:hypothetical protein
MEQPTPEAWAKKRTEALALMESTRSLPKVLVEISSQHNLVNGVPGPEYTLRLEYGLALFHRLSAQGLHVEVVTLGSIHKPDAVSLSEAGTRWLRERGVPAEVLHGDDLIDRYKGPGVPWPGVYNSADEAFVAASYFRDEEFGQIHCIAGSAQVHRKALHYLWIGVLPQMHGVPFQDAYHDFVREAQDFLPFVLSIDPDNQAPDSRAAKRSRDERMP